ncbi:MAG: ParB/RepB/Spo0J family partition protein [Lachnospiraceae bacterium]|nr:ParB/RepB/Spo0J family partition protein [Lachnospiraceae bacterium]
MAEKRKRSGLGKGLGKGIDALITVAEPEENHEEESGEKTPHMLDIHLVEPNREQPRKIFDDESLAELADSIRQYGILQPLLVQKKDDYYAIIAGERRWRAARLAGLKEVPVVIRELSRQESMEISLIENIQREDLNPVEEARAYQMLIQEFGLRHEELAERVSKSRAAVTNSMRLLKLDESVLDMLIRGDLTQGHARALLALEDKNMQLHAAQMVIDRNLSVRDAEKLIKTLLNPPEKKEKGILPGQAVYRDLEKKLKDSLGTRVAISRKNENQGKIEISYYSVEELERITEILEKVR